MISWLDEFSEENPKSRLDFKNEDQIINFEYRELMKSD
jgi:hypothetical protein